MRRVLRGVVVGFLHLDDRFDVYLVVGNERDAHAPPVVGVRRFGERTPLSTAAHGCAIVSRSHAFAQAQGP